MIVHQWIPAAHRGDAIGNSARVTRDCLRAWGHQSDIFVMTMDDGMDEEFGIRSWSEPDSRHGAVTILHFAVPSPMTDAFASLAGKRVLQYHNITPPHFFAPFDTALARLVIIGRRELASLAGRVDLALGDSEFNRRELDALGFARTGVLPIVVDLDRLTGAPPVPWLDRELEDGLANILFVGRIAPNKKIEDHIRMIEFYKRYVDSEYRFIFVGRTDAVPKYGDAIRRLVWQYQMRPDRVRFVGDVPDDELAAYYRHAHAYVSLSEHEGFCVPLLEAMAMQVPILAYAAAAVPETLGGAGVTFAPKDLEQASELLGEIIYNESLRRQLLAGQHRRLQDFGRAGIEARLQAALAEVA